MLIETHAHLDYPDFANDFDDVLRRATEAGVTVTFNPSTHLVAKNISLMGTLGLESYQDAVVAGRILEAARLPFELMVSHQLPLERVADAIEALNSDYRVDGRTALKIAIAPNGPVA